MTSMIMPLTPHLRRPMAFCAYLIFGFFPVIPQCSSDNTPPAFPGWRLSGAARGAASLVQFYRGLECGLDSPDHTAKIAADGSYEVRSIPSGVYAACLPQPDGAPGYFGPLNFQVGLEDLRLDLDFEEGPFSSGAARMSRFLAAPGMKGAAALDGFEAGKTVMGRVTRSVSIEAPERSGLESTAVVYLIPADRPGTLARPVVALPTSLEMPADGEFIIENVPPGRYILVATGPDSGSRLRGETGAVSVGRLALSIEGWELPTLSIIVQRGVSVSGRVVRNGSPVSGVALMLEPDIDVAGVLAYQDVARFRPPIGADGSFTFPQVPEGRYRLRAAVVGLPESAIRISQNGKDITESGLVITDMAPAPIEVSLQ